MFDVKAFNRAKFEHKTKAIKIPALSSFFGDKEPEWTVRGMSHSEFSTIMNAGENDGVMDSVISALSGNDKEKIDVIKNLLGKTNDISAATRKRIEALKICSVDPVCDQALAVKLAEFFPTEFEALTKTIFELTDEGPALAKKKPRAYTETAESN